MKKALVIIDMQNDFISGSLGSDAARGIVPAVVRKIEEHKSQGSELIFTRDTHDANYLSTCEGKHLPVIHCVKDTQGWQIASEVSASAEGYPYKIVDKITFGSTELAQYLSANAPYDEIEIAGLVSSICVVSNALIIKAHLPETKITVDALCTAGVTAEDFEASLCTMKMCHIEIRNA